MQFFHFFSVHFREGADLRLRIMMYFMTALLVYFIFDFSATHAVNRLDDLEKSLTEKKEEIEITTALIDRIPAIIKKNQSLKTQKLELELKHKNVLGRITRCNEKMLAGMLNFGDSGDSPFYQFQVSKNNQVGTLEHLIYTIELKGAFENIVKSLQKLDDSFCRWNVSSWHFEIDSDDENIVSGTLVLDLFKPTEERK